MRILGLMLAAGMLISGCAGQEPFASDEAVAAVSYRNEGQSELTLFTVINNRSGAGAHTSLLIDASERVLFDPAGSFKANGIPERNDVLFGISPQAERVYISAHARETFRVRIQTVSVSPQQAEIAYRLATANGPVAGAFCANATSALLQQVPGFENIGTTFSPIRLSDQFGEIRGVTTTEYREDDDASLQTALDQLN